MERSRNHPFKMEKGKIAKRKTKGKGKGNKGGPPPGTAEFYIQNSITPRNLPPDEVDRFTPYATGISHRRERFKKYFEVAEKEAWEANAPVWTGGDPNDS